VPTGFARDWLTRNYYSLLTDAVQAAGLRLQMIPLEFDPSDLRVRISVHQPQDPRGRARTNGTQLTNAAGGAVPAASESVQSEPGGLARRDPAVDPPEPAAAPEGEADGLERESSGSEDGGATGNERDPAPAEPCWDAGPPPPAARLPFPGHAGGSERSGASGRATNLLGELTLNPGYTFDQFVVGPCNRLGHAAALAVSENPGRAYNPLYVHGEVGLGKTHVLQAICHGILRRQRNARLLYVSCEEFTNRFIHSIQAGTLEEFRQLFRGVDVLVVDDVQFMSGKERTQEEFFHTFNALYNQQKQIVISSDHHPMQATAIEDRLVSRFKWGLVTEMEPPCYETRVAIVKRKSHMRGTDFADDIAYYVAERVATNIREIEGAVIKVIGFAAIMERPITLSLVEDALRGTLAPVVAQTSLEQITDLVSGEFSVTMRDLAGKSRSQTHALPRHIAMFLARELLSLPFEEIGRRFGGRDHTTVMYSVQKIKDRVGADRMFRDTVNAMLTRLGQKAR
jgi:chromosomal replication initiator protein